MRQAIGCLYGVWWMGDVNEVGDDDGICFICSVMVGVVDKFRRIISICVHKCRM